MPSYNFPSDNFPLLMEGKIPSAKLVKEVEAEDVRVAQTDGGKWFMVMTGKDSVVIPDDYADSCRIAAHQQQFYSTSSSLCRRNGKALFKRGVTDYLTSYMIYLNTLMSMVVDELKQDRRSPRLLFHFALMMASNSHLLDADVHSTLKRLYAVDWKKIKEGVGLKKLDDFIKGGYHQRYCKQDLNACGDTSTHEEHVDDTALRYVKTLLLAGKTLKYPPSSNPTPNNLASSAEQKEGEKLVIRISPPKPLAPEDDIPKASENVDDDHMALDTADEEHMQVDSDARSEQRSVEQSIMSKGDNELGNCLIPWILSELQFLSGIKHDGPFLPLPTEERFRNKHDHLMALGMERFLSALVQPEDDYLRHIFHTLGASTPHNRELTQSHPFVSRLPILPRLTPDLWNEHLRARGQRYQHAAVGPDENQLPSDEYTSIVDTGDHLPPLPETETPPAIEMVDTRPDKRPTSPSIPHGGRGPSKRQKSEEGGCI